MIAHVSQPSIEESQDASKFKEVHLGYRGTARLFKDCQPHLALIGEFWAGFTDVRISLVKGLRQRLLVQAVLPAGLAMHLRLASLEIKCTKFKKPTRSPKSKSHRRPTILGSSGKMVRQVLLMAVGEGEPEFAISRVWRARGL